MDRSKSIPFLLFLLAISSLQSIHAGSATWLPTPVNGVWNRAGNWTPATIPNGSSDVATFNTSSVTAISLTDNTQVDSVIFSPGASPYTITDSSFAFSLTGAGIINNSSITQSFVVAAKPSQATNGTLAFINSASAGTQTSFTVKGGSDSSNGFIGEVDFFNTSNAAQGNFSVQGSSRSGSDGGMLTFHDSSSAGSGVFAFDGGSVSGAYGASVGLNGTANAGSGNFTLRGAAVAGAFGAEMDISENAILGNATITINGGSAVNAAGAICNLTTTGGEGGAATLTINGGSASGAAGGYFGFHPGADSTGAWNVTVNGGSSGGALGGAMDCGGFETGNSTYTVNGGRGNAATGGRLTIANTVGVRGTLIANGGSNRGLGGTIFLSNVTAGPPPRLEAFGNGTIDLSAWLSGANTASSIEGSGIILLGSQNLTVGSTITTTFSGSLRDGGVNGGTGASLTKVGVGTLTLSGSNTYTGGTTVSGGTLLVSNTSGSGTGKGTVLVLGRGTLGGTGIISAALLVGSAAGPTAFVAPGDSGIGNLTINKSATLKSTTQYSCEINSDNATADRLTCKGILVGTGAQIVFTELGNSTLPLGTVLTVVNNTGVGGFGGTFTNLPQGTTFSLGPNKYQASYTGGTGNDLTLTVVP